MSQYWIANEPNSTVTAAQAQALAAQARGTTSTAVAGYLAAFGAGLGSTLAANNYAALASTVTGAIDLKQIIWSSSVADPTIFADITISPTSRVLVTTALASANGVVVNLANNSGQIKIQCKTSTGGSVNRYLLLFSS